MNIIVFINSSMDCRGNSIHSCFDAKVECSPRDGFNNKKLLKFEGDLRDFINKGLADAQEEGGLS